MMSGVDPRSCISPDRQDRPGVPPSEPSLSSRQPPSSLRGHVGSSSSGYPSSARDSSTEPSNSVANRGNALYTAHRLAPRNGGASKRGFSLDDEDDEVESSASVLSDRGIGGSRRPVYGDPGVNAIRATTTAQRTSDVTARSNLNGSSTVVAAGSSRHPAAPRRPYALDDDDDDDDALSEYPARSRVSELRSDVRMGDGSYAEDDDLEVVDFEYENDNEVKKLSRAWVRERGTKNIMRWEGDLVEEVLHRLSQQAKMIELLKADAQTTDEEHFKLMLVQTEMERVKFLVRAYIRTRIEKVEKYAQHIVNNPSLHSSLSQLELQHATRYNRLLITHFQDSVLNSLPDWLRGMEDRANDGLSMVREPDPKAVVLVHCLRDEPSITLTDGTRLPLTKGSTHLLRYSLVERYIQLGSLEVW